MLIGCVKAALMYVPLTANRSFAGRPGDAVLAETFADIIEAKGTIPMRVIHCLREILLPDDVFISNGLLFSEFICLPFVPYLKFNVKKITLKEVKRAGFSLGRDFHVAWLLEASKR